MAVAETSLAPVDAQHTYRSSTLHVDPLPAKQTVDRPQYNDLKLSWPACPLGSASALLVMARL